MPRASVTGRIGVITAGRASITALRMLHRLLPHRRLPLHPRQQLPRSTLRERRYDGQRRRYESGVNGLPMMSMNTAAAPSAPVRFPSRTSTSKVSRSPSSFGVFSTTTASRIAEPSLLKRRYRCVRGVSCKVVGPHCPIFNDVAREVVSCRTNRPVSENDRVWRHPGKHKFIALQADALRVEDDERRNDFRLGHASDGFLQRHMWRSGRGSLCKCYPRRTKRTNHGHDNKGNACHDCPPAISLVVFTQARLAAKFSSQVSCQRFSFGPLFLASRRSRLKAATWSLDRGPERHGANVCLDHQHTYRIGVLRYSNRAAKTFGCYCRGTHHADGLRSLP